MTTKDLANYVLLSEKKTESFVKARSRNWLIAAGIAFVLIIVLVVVIFRKTTEADQSYKNKVNTLDSTIKYQAKTIESLERFNVEQDSAIQNLNEAYKKNRPTETRIIHQYEKVNTDVHNLSNSQLDSELSKYDY
jgi:membrane-associated HD superfamily phosphohydrolase